MDFEKRLPLADPMINHTPPIDNVLSILSTCKKVADPMIFQNYIGIVCAENLLQNPWVEFKDFAKFVNTPCLTTYKIPHYIVKSDFIPFIKNAIQNNLYCMYNHETFYISNYLKFNQYHQRHEILIYGYTGNDTFLCKDYFNYRNYASQEVDMYQAEKAYSNYILAEPNDYFSGVILFQLNEYASFEIDMSKVYADLKMLVYGLHLSIGTEQSNRGLDYFEKLIHYTSHTAGEYLFTKLFSFVNAHITMMKYRVAYLNGILPELVPFADDISELQQRSAIMINLALKYNLMHDTSIKERVLVYLKSIYKEYEAFLIKFINVISML